MCLKDNMTCVPGQQCYRNVLDGYKIYPYPNTTEIILINNNESVEGLAPLLIVQNYR